MPVPGRTNKDIERRRVIHMLSILLFYCIVFDGYYSRADDERGVEGLDDMWILGNRFCVKRFN